MTPLRSLLPGKTFATITTWLAIVSACGSRTVIDYSDLAHSGGSNDPGGSTGGSSGIAGSTVVGTGGTTRPSCQNVDCDAVACGPGLVSTMVSGQCCPICLPCEVPCPVLRCGPGTHFETPPGQCCGSCVANPRPCDEGKKEYIALRTALLDKFGFVTCARDADCVVATEQNQCASTCGVALPAVTVNDWKSSTIAAAQSNCANCPAIAPPRCIKYFATCITGRCILLGTM